MDIIGFTLSGRFAFFKKPDVNSYFYFTYSNIHKIALLGIFGGMLGYGGYNQQRSEVYPEFYSRLKGLKISIVPREAIMPKKIQIFNNSVGYASQEQGGNLIIKEQWLENPCWNIYVAIENEEGKKIARALLENNYVYIPYLGKNDHPADITDVRLFKDVKLVSDFDSINSLFKKSDFKFTKDYEEDDLCIEEVPVYKYEEKLPLYLEEETNKYESESFIYTNSKLKAVTNVPVYNVEDKNIVFI